MPASSPNNTTSGQSKSILITGCSTGIGKCAAQTLQQQGWQVFATARKPEDLQMLKEELGVEALYMDYRDEASIKAVAETVLEKTNGKLFALFNNGAYGQPGAVEDLPTAALREQFEANFFGWHDLTKRLIPAMRANNQGRIIQCSSIFGFVSAHYRGAYNASKYAVEALSDAMRQELRDTNIKVAIIEPGPIRTEFVPRCLQAYEENIDTENSPHKESYKARIAAMKKGGTDKFKLEPDVVVDKLIHALTSKSPKIRYYVTVPTYVLAYAKRFLPTRIMDKILINN